MTQAAREVVREKNNCKGKQIIVITATSQVIRQKHAQPDQEIVLKDENEEPEHGVETGKTRKSISGDGISEIDIILKVMHKTKPRVGTGIKVS